LYVSVACCCREKVVEREERGRFVVRWIIVILSRFILFNDNLANNNSSPFSSPPRPLRLCVRNFFSHYSFKLPMVIPEMINRDMKA
jgi:hypothetical protein